MKKIAVLLLSFILAMGLTGCRLTEEDVNTISEIIDVITDNGSGTSASVSEPSVSVSTPTELSVSISETSTDVSIPEAPQEVVEEISYHFRNAKLLNQHYEKHGIEMGFDSAESYEKAAGDVINNPKALTKTEKEDGDYIFYIEETNEFVVLSTDGYIRTYFLPSSGKKYFDKQ